MSDITKYLEEILKENPNYFKEGTPAETADSKYLREMKGKLSPERFAKYNQARLGSGAGLGAGAAGAGLAAALYSEGLNPNEMEDLEQYKLENPDNGVSDQVDSAKLNALSNMRTTAERDMANNLSDLGSEVIEGNGLETELDSEQLIKIQELLKDRA